MDFGKIIAEAKQKGNIDGRLERFRNFVEKGVGEIIAVFYSCKRNIIYSFESNREIIYKDGKLSTINTPKTFIWSKSQHITTQDTLIYRDKKFKISPDYLTYFDKDEITSILEELGFVDIQYESNVMYGSLDTYDTDMAAVDIRFSLPDIDDILEQAYEHYDENYAHIQNKLVETACHDIIATYKKNKNAKMFKIDVDEKIKDKLEEILQESNICYQFIKTGYVKKIVHPELESEREGAMFRLTIYRTEPKGAIF